MWYCFIPEIGRERLSLLHSRHTTTHSLREVRVVASRIPASIRTSCPSCSTPPAPAHLPSHNGERCRSRDDPLYIEQRAAAGPWDRSAAHAHTAPALCCADHSRLAGCAGRSRRRRRVGEDGRCAALGILQNQGYRASSADGAGFWCDQASLFVWGECWHCNSICRLRPGRTGGDCGRAVNDAGECSGQDYRVRC